MLYCFVPGESHWEVIVEWFVLSWYKLLSFFSISSGYWFKIKHIHDKFYTKLESNMTSTDRCKSHKRKRENVKQTMFNTIYFFSRTHLFLVFLWYNFLYVIKVITRNCCLRLCLCVWYKLNNTREKILYNVYFSTPKSTGGTWKLRGVYRNFRKRFKFFFLHYSHMPLRDNSETLFQQKNLFRIYYRFSLWSQR